MKVLLAQHSGFCFGVKRALELALNAADVQKPIYTIGPLIHSPQMVHKLEEKGIRLLENPEDIKDSTVIIRSHGITKEQRDILIQNENTLIDATCPYVNTAQQYIHQLCAEGYPVIVLGDKNHPEVVAMLSYCSTETLVIKSVAELPDKAWQKLGLISQTTRNMSALQELVNELVPRVKELRLFNTICTATSLRQEATTRLAGQCDLMIVIGGRNSSNTKMLASLCGEITETLHVETAQEITLEMLSGHDIIGLTAGASTPDYLIVEVFNTINKLTGNRTTVTSVEDIPVN